MKEKRKLTKDTPNNHDKLLNELLENEKNKQAVLNEITRQEKTVTMLNTAK